MNNCSVCYFYKPLNWGTQPNDLVCHRKQRPFKCPPTHWCGDFKPSVKRKVKAMDVSAELLIFDEARKIYPGTKAGNDVEFLNFRNKHKSDWKEALLLLKPAIERQIVWRKSKALDTYPHWRGFERWISTSYWTFSPETGQQTLKKCHVCKLVKETRLKVLKDSMKTSKSPVCSSCWDKC